MKTINTLASHHIDADHAKTAILTAVAFGLILAISLI